MTIDRRVTRIETKQLMAQVLLPVAVVVVGGGLGWIMTMMNGNMEHLTRSVDGMREDFKEVIVVQATEIRARIDFEKSTKKEFLSLRGDLYDMAWKTNGMWQTLPKDERKMLLHKYVEENK